MKEELPKDATPIFWKREITMGQAWGFIITILTLVFTGWMDMRITLAEHETRINAIEKSYDEVKTSIKEGNVQQNDNHSKTIEAINDLKLQLKDKQNRK